jgi:predicted site-specific integrase-resolvase
MLAISPVPTDRCWTIEDVAAFFRVSVVTARGWHKSGRIPRGRKLGRRWLWVPSEVQTKLVPSSLGESKGA